MAKSSAKKINSSNKALLQYLLLAILLSNCIFLGTTWATQKELSRKGKVVYGVTQAIVFVLYSLASSWGRGGVDGQGQVTSGEDLINSKGLIEYLMDTLYISILVTALAAYSMKAFYIMLLIPIFFGYKMVSMGGNALQGVLGNSTSTDVPSRQKQVKLRKQ